MHTRSLQRGFQYLTMIALVLVSAAQPANAADKVTHLGVPPDDFVALLTADVADINGAMVRVFPDLTFEGGVGDTFEVPDGKMFIITDVEVEFRGNAATQNGASATASLVLTDPGVAGRVPWFGQATLDFNANGYVSAHFTTGIATSSGIEVTLVGTATPGPSVGVRANVQGYLLDE